MTTRADVNRLSQATARLVAMAREDLLRMFGAVDLGSPEAARDALLEVVPALTREYGEVAATVAAEWYEEVRAEQAAGRFAATLANVADEAAVQGSVRYASGHLFTDDPAQTLAVLSGALQRYIAYASRETVARNVALDPSKPRFARVPTGRVTCAFCTMLASRGFVYHSRKSAGDMDEWHDNCDCQVVPEWDREGHHIDGYDPDAMFALYEAAADAVGSRTDTSAILAEMRRMSPESFTDGVRAVA